MIDDSIVLTIERLRDELVELRASIKSRYRKPTSPVIASEMKATAARIAETWMVNVAPRLEATSAISSDYVADLNVHFQRLLTFSERSSQRSRYDAEIKDILNKYTVGLIIPLKQQVREGGVEVREVPPNPQVGMASVEETDRNRSGFTPTAFVGHSFTASDELVAKAIIQTLESIGITVITGEKPRADRISEKVKEMIEGQFLFIGVFTRRDKIARKNEWTTTSWVIDEKAYAVGKGKKMILFKEKGVSSIGGIQGDYEYIEFSREQLHEIIIRLLGMFNISVNGFAS
jgi:hypothetical protein